MNFQGRNKNGSAVVAESCAFFALSTLMDAQEMLGKSQTRRSTSRVCHAKWID
jgi:hypothetical protein